MWIWLGITAVVALGELLTTACSSLRLPWPESWLPWPHHPCPYVPAHAFVEGNVVEVLLVDGVVALLAALPPATPLRAIGSLTSIQKGIES